VAKAFSYQIAGKLQDSKLNIETRTGAKYQGTGGAWDPSRNGPSLDPIEGPVESSSASSPTELVGDAIGSASSHSSPILDKERIELSLPSP
jgi:hypothetical protein